ncbi:MAG: NAD(P)/FAD-dependent oxidoreductase [Myxococcota bacterium]
MHVVIVGAGPAGSSAATFLAQQGASVTLLERSHFPRDKVCGDGCTPRAVWMLEALGLGELVREASAAAPVDALYGASPSGLVLDAEIPKSIFGGRGCVIARQVLDQRLVQRAVQAGATLREGVRVEGIHREEQGVAVRCRGGETVRADVVLGCDGAPSVVRSSLGAPDFPSAHRAVALRVYYENVRLSRPHAFGIFWEKDLLPGYGWVFPLPGNRANIGVGMRADLLEAQPYRINELLERFCALPRIAAELQGATRVGKPKGHHLPFGSFASRLVFDRALLLGDAAGFVNPLTGEGIEFALESGRFAAAAVVEADQVGDLGVRGLTGYGRRCRKRFEAVFRLNHRMASFFSRPRLVDRFFRAATRSEQVRQALAGVLLGEAPRLGWRLWAAVAFGR